MPSQANPEYKCLYNHELLILFTTESPYQSYRDDVSSAQVEGYVRELADTQVDALMCCPTAWKTPLYYSEVDRKWQDEAPNEVERLPEGDWKYAEKVYWRVRRYMLKGEDPVAISLRTAREIGIGFIMSYRMNELHYNPLRDLRVHSTFWRDHPELYIRPHATIGSTDMLLNYLEPAVCDHYRAILFELIDKYDIDGFELDFMRHGRFFPDDQVDAGRECMTEFVREVRQKLDAVGEQRDKRLSLGVRVPRTLELAFETGLDVAAWDGEGLVDMVNASPHFRHNLDVDIEGFKREVRQARVYGEMHFVTDAGRLSSGFTNNINRRTTRTLYETNALNFWDRGADGVSLFNFAYARHHYFGEPRRKQLPGVEPPFDVLKRICDVDYLRGRPKHYRKTAAIPPIAEELGSVPASVPARGEAHVSIRVTDRLEEGHPFTSALLRLESTQEITGLPLQVSLNGQLLAPTFGLGELFPPLSAEAIPHYENLLFFTVPLDAVRHGDNRVAIENHIDQESGAVKIDAVDLALYC